MLNPRTSIKSKPKAQGKKKQSNERPPKESFKKSIYEEALDNSKLRKKRKGKEGKIMKSEADICGTKSVQSAELDLEGDPMHFRLYENTLYQMKDHLKSLQLKDAIDRSNLQKQERENKSLKDKLDKFNADLTKSEKMRNNDGTYIMRQEELIAKMQLNKKTKTVGENEKKSLKDEYEELVHENTKLQEDIQELRQLESKNNPIAHYEQSSQLLTKIKKTLISRDNHLLPGLFMDQLHLYESNLKLQTQETKIFGEYIQSSNGRLKKERANVNQKVKMLKKERITDQKRIMDLQKRLGYLEEEIDADKTKLIKNSNVMGMDINSEETFARGKVDDILGRLKDKLLDIEEKNVETHKFINRLAVIGSVQQSAELDHTQSNKLSILPTETY